MKTDKVLSDVIKLMSARIAHIEDIQADNRDLLIRLAKQGNEIVKFLKDVDIETDQIDDDKIFSNPTSLQNNNELTGFKNYENLLDEIFEKQEDLKEFEEEMQKHKDKLTPGQVGES